MATRYILRCKACQIMTDHATTASRHAWAQDHAKQHPGHHSFDWTDAGLDPPTTGDRDAWIDLEQRMTRVDNELLSLRDRNIATQTSPKRIMTDVRARSGGMAKAYEHAATLLRTSLNEWRREREDAEANPVDPNPFPLRDGIRVDLQAEENTRELPNDDGTSQLINVTMFRNRSTGKIAVNGERTDSIVQALSRIGELMHAQQDAIEGTDR